MKLRTNGAVRALRARRVGAFERRQQALALVVARLRADAQRPPLVGTGAGAGAAPSSRRDGF
jgi:hypothetical protein